MDLMSYHKGNKLYRPKKKGLLGSLHLQAGLSGTWMLLWLWQKSDYYQYVAWIIKYDLFIALAEEQRMFCFQLRQPQQFLRLAAKMDNLLMEGVSSILFWAKFQHLVRLLTTLLKLLFWLVILVISSLFIVLGM